MWGENWELTIEFDNKEVISDLDRNILIFQHFRGRMSTWQQIADREIENEKILLLAVTVELVSNQPPAEITRKAGF